MSNPTFSATGAKMWLNDTGLYHRTDGPAYQDDNVGYWYQNGQLHREDGPAIEGYFGYKGYYYHGQYFDCQDTNTFLRMLKLKAFL